MSGQKFRPGDRVVTRVPPVGEGVVISADEWEVVIKFNGYEHPMAYGQSVVSLAALAKATERTP